MKKKIKYFLICLLMLTVCRMNVKAYQVDPAELPKSTYVIGNSIYTRETVTGGYNGQLTTPYIMLASKTIVGNTINDMVIYYKNARGAWVNALTNESVTMNRGLDIKYKNGLMLPLISATNMGANSSEGGATGISYSVSYNATDFTTGVSGWELYVEDEEATENYITVDSKKYVIVDNAITTTSKDILVEFPNKNKYIARLYETVNETKKYSAWSNIITLSAEIPMPEVISATNLSGDTFGFDYEFVINREDFNDAEDNSYINGWRVWKKGASETEAYNKTIGGVVYSMTTIEPHTIESVTTCLVPYTGTNYYLVEVMVNNSLSVYSQEYALTAAIEKPELNVLDPSYDAATDSFIYGVKLANRDSYLDKRSETEISYLGTNNLKLYVEDEEGALTVGTKKYSLVEGVTNNAYSLTLARGVTKKYIARLELTDGARNKMYSDWSDEIIIDSTLPTPRLAYSYLSYDEENDKFSYDIGITYLAPGAGGGTPYFDGWQLYVEDANGTETIDSTKYSLVQDLEPSTVKNVAISSKIKYIARTYITVGETKVYSEWSKAEKIDYIPSPTIKRPALVSGSEENYTFALSIDQSKYLNSGGISYISGWELMIANPEGNITINNEKFVLYGETSTSISYSTEATFEFPKVSARAFITKSDNTKIYSDYSTPVILEYLPSPILTAKKTSNYMTPILASQEQINYMTSTYKISFEKEAYLDTNTNDSYAYGIWELYVEDESGTLTVNGKKYKLVYSGTETEYTEYIVQGTTNNYISRMKSFGIYSDWSDILTTK